MNKTIQQNYWIQSVLNSYSLVFFSLNNLFALCILLVTFFTPFVGICGFMGILITNVVANYLGFDKKDIHSGMFGFNALFLGMAMGYEFNVNGPFLVLFLSAMLILLLITVSMRGYLNKYNLPFLVFPFIITYWLVSLSASNFDNIILNESHSYTINQNLKESTSIWYQITHTLDSFPLFPFVAAYLKTLAGTFFQNSILAGVLIALGLLQFSRIAFSLSIIGFSCAYFYYVIFGADVSDLTHDLLGANFIFTAIAIGCFFIIPNTYSYLLVVVLTPVVLLSALALTKILAPFQIKPYSLSFSLITTLVLFALNQRLFTKYLQVVTLQYFSAEKTIYKYINSLQRFKNEHLYKVILPFIGEWNVSQGYDGNITHLGDWSKALDFVIEDSEENTYFLPANLKEGMKPENFYCYNKEILAPYDGYVYDIINTVDDNDIGDMDTSNNWGNSIIINHLNGLFSQISHIKKDSFGVFVGQYIKKGTFLGTCGNSGRSPEPHIHFQFQTAPYLGSKTFPYPIAYFIERKGGKRKLRISEVPNEKAFISNVLVSELLAVGFSLLPGQKLSLKNTQTNEKVYWEVFTDAFNRTHIYCKASKSTAYFKNDGTMFYFTDFEGDKKSLLFQFYLAAYRQLLGYYEGVDVEDKIPLIHFNKKIPQFFQDFLAPFYLFTQANYKASFEYADNIYAPQHLKIKASVEAKLVDYSFKKTNFELELKDYKLNSFTIHHKKHTEQYLFEFE
ncbi:MAG: urea transporter [Flavicella sp.]